MATKNWYVKPQSINFFSGIASQHVDIKPFLSTEAGPAVRAC